MCIGRYVRMISETFFAAGAGRLRGCRQRDRTAPAPNQTPTPVLRDQVSGRWGRVARPSRSYGAAAGWLHAAAGAALGCPPPPPRPPSPRSRFTIPPRSDGANAVSSPALSAAHTPPCSHAGFSRAMNNLEAPSINTRSGMSGAHSTRQPHRRQGAGAAAEEPHHEVSPGLPRLWPPPPARPPRRRRRPAAVAAAPPAAAAGRRRPAARRRLLGGGRAGGSGGAAGGAARLRAGGPAAAKPGGSAAGGGG